VISIPSIVAATIPALKRTELPGRKKPKKSPVSMKITPPTMR
jgi:hypothetical protein